MEFDDELLKEFLNESWDNLEKLDQDFGELEQNPEDPEIITRIFRVIHTMKGCSGLIGFGKLEKISHYAEDILSQVREGVRTVDPPMVTKLLDAADALKEILRVVEETRENEGDVDYSDLIEELELMAVGSGGSAASVVDSPKKKDAPESEETGDGEHYANRWQVSVIMDESEKMPSIRALVIVERLGDFGHVDEVIPDVRGDQGLMEGELCPRSVREAKPGMPVAPGNVYIAPGDYHMEIVRSPGAREATIRTHQGPNICSCRPSVDVMFRSIANSYGDNTIAVIMTGMGQDGFEGTKVLKELGVFVIAQNEATCVVYGMPSFIVDNGLADSVLPLDAIAGELAGLVK